MLSVLLALLGSAVPDAEAVFPGKPGRIAFSAQGYRGDDFAFTLKDLNPRTKRVRQLTRPTCTAPDEFGTEWEDRAPDYSPDGRQIAYLHSDRCPGADARIGVWVMRSDGSQGRRIAPLADGASVAFSPDGRRLAVSWITFGEEPKLYVQEVYSVADGVLRTRHQRRVDTYAGVEGTDWSSRGRIVAGIGGSIRVLNPDGSGLRTLTSTAEFADSLWPDWSPSGRTLLYIRDHTDDFELAGDIMRLSAKGGRPKRVREGYSYSPVMSPSTRQIAFSDGEALRVMAARGGRPRRVTRVFESLYGLDWQALR